MAITRRALLEVLAALGLSTACRAGAGAPGPEPQPDTDTEPSPPGADAPEAVRADAPTDTERFAWGVASGDPLADRVILWTRVQPPKNPRAPLPLAWRVATDPAMTQTVAAGRAEATAERDYTLKIDAAGLEAGTTYYYRFALLPHGADAPADGPLPHSLPHSAIGRTRTLPTGALERLRLAFCSCSNYPFGFFNAYAAMARRADLDVVLHLGDYLYEYANGRYGDGTALGRVPEPAGELVSLADYRARHRTYKGDPDLQELHRQHPMIAVWDDHELANDAWTDGAKNHDPSTQGEWATRETAAVRAYHEWMPIRGDGPTIHRRFRFGDLVDLFMLDTRLEGRQRQLERSAAVDDPTRLDPERTLLGAEQERWLFEGLRESAKAGTSWRVLGQQLILAPMRFAEGGSPSTDAWDGYPAARARLLDSLREGQVEDVIALSGDVHSSWAFEVGPDPFVDAGHPEAARPVGLVEFVAPAVTSSTPAWSGVRPPWSGCGRSRPSRPGPAGRSTPGPPTSARSGCGA